MVVNISKGVAVGAEEAEDWREGALVKHRWKKVEAEEKEVETGGEGEGVVVVEEEGRRLCAEVFWEARTAVVRRVRRILLFVLVYQKMFPCANNSSVLFFFICLVRCVAIECS